MLWQTQGQGRMYHLCFEHDGGTLKHCLRFTSGPAFSHFSPPLTGLKAGGAAVANSGSAPELSRFPGGLPCTGLNHLTPPPPRQSRSSRPNWVLDRRVATRSAPHPAAILPPRPAAVFSSRSAAFRLWRRQQPLPPRRHFPLPSRSAAQGACAARRRAALPPDWRRGPTNERGGYWGRRGGGGGTTMRAAVWNARAALLYSLGGWTMLGAVLHYNFNSGGTETGGGPGTG